MNKRICKNAKNYKLTEGQEYEILNEEDSYVFIINDNGKNVRYDASLFENPLPPPPARTEQDCINSITYDGNTLRYIDIEEEVKTLNHIRLTQHSTNSFSCGVVRLEGLNSVSEQIELQSFVNTELDDFIELKKALFRKVFEYWTTRGNYGMWMCSTNQDTRYEDHHLILDSLSTHNSGWFRNPNSGNQIKVWYGIRNQD